MTWILSWSSANWGGKLDGEDPFLVSFLRGADYIEHVYDLLRSDDTRRFLQKQGKENPLVQKIVEFLNRNDLTEFKRFRDFFAPSGTFAYNEPTGLHFGFFTLRAEVKEKGSRKRSTSTRK